MSKTTIIAITAAIIIALGGYNLVFRNKTTQENILPGSNNEIPNTENVNQVADKLAGKKMAFSQFIKQDFGPYKCEVKQALSDFESTGTVYMNEGKLRGEFSTVAEGRKMDSSFIMKEGYTYNWSSIVPMGVKVKIPEKGMTGDINTNTSGTYSWNAEQIGEYNCEEWKVDEAMFELPTNIKFTEIKA